MNAISIPLKAELIVDVKMVLARNVFPATKMEYVTSVTFKGDGTYDGGITGLWEIKDGQLVMSDVWKKPMFFFRGAETRNGSVFLTGEPLMEARVSGFVRSVLYPSKQLGDNFRICISSHADYMDDTIPRLLRSLSRLSFPKDRVLIVVGGVKEPIAEVVDGWSRRSVTQNFDGYTALAELVANPVDFDGYWLLLHDTTEVSETFLSVMQNIDVGLNYDMLIRYAEIGLYSSAFIRLLGAQNAFNVKVIKKDCLSDFSSLWCELNSTSNTHAATKDVYGTGTQRDVIYLGDFGIKKFRRVKGARAKP